MTGVPRWVRRSNVELRQTVRRSHPIIYSGHKRQRGERRRLQVRAKLREIRRNARHSIGRMDRGRSATIGCGETAPAQTALSCAGLSGRPALRQISAAARVQGLRGDFRPNGLKKHTHWPPAESRRAAHTRVSVDPMSVRERGGDQGMGPNQAFALLSS